MARLTSPKPHVEVLPRVFDLSRRGMSTALAEGILALDFPEEDAARIEELNAKANDGELTDEEETELEAYANINELLLAVEGASEVTAAGISGPADAVRQCASYPCEYCRLPKGAFRRGFHIEHIIARQHGGSTSLDNLAFACWTC